MASTRYALLGRAVWKVGKICAPRAAKRWRERRGEPAQPPTRNP